MANQARFEILLPVRRRQALERLAIETGLSASALAKLGVAWVLRRPKILFDREDDRDHEEAA